MVVEPVGLLVVEPVTLAKLVEQTKAAAVALEEETVLHLMEELEDLVEQV